VAESIRLPPAKAWREQWALETPQLTYSIPNTIEALGQAFNATWLEVHARDPFHDFERDSELKTAISQKLSMLAADGVTDPIELREWALEGYVRR
jgi:hypothetical protein